jgi:hypothetical protein
MRVEHLTPDSFFSVFIMQGNASDVVKELNPNYYITFYLEIFQTEKEISLQNFQMQIILICKTSVQIPTP